MPHATMKLIPGIDTNKTVALNEAAFSASQLIRFIPDRSNMGLAQKMGGWVNWYGAAANQSPISNITELHAWEDLNNNARLAVGANASLSYIGQSNKLNVNITPQSTSGDSLVSSGSTVTISIASPIVITATPSTTPANGTPITFTTSVGGLLPAPLLVGKVYYVYAANSGAGTYKIVDSLSSSTPINATSLTTTTASGTGTTATISFATQASAPPVGGTVIVSGVTPSGYNGTFTITSSSTSSVSYANTTTGAQTVAGTVAFQAGTITATVPIASTTAGSTTVTIYDLGTGVQSVSFASNLVTVGTQGSGAAGIVPATGAQVVFTGGSLPSGVTANTAYYVINPTANTYQISTPITVTGASGNGTTATLTFAALSAAPPVNSVVTISGVSPSGYNGTYTITASSTTSISFLNTTTTTYVSGGTIYNSPVVFGSGSGTQYSSTLTLPFIEKGYSVNILTPISISNFILSGVYNVGAPTSGTYYNIYTIESSVAATTTSAIGTLPTFTTAQNLNTITVAENFNSYIAGQTVAFLYPTSASGTIIYGNYFVQSSPAPTSSSYTITGTGAAATTTTVTMNNGYAHFQYYFNIVSSSTSGGYGTGQYGYGGYGQGLPLVISPTNTITSTDWSINNFGEILIANPQGGPIYYWSPTNSTSTAFLLNTAPQVNQGIFIAMPQRQIVAYGSTATGIQDPLLVRWSDISDATNWTPTANNYAGSFRIPEGSNIVGALQGPQQAIVWTDIAVWSMQYVGLPNVYGFNKLGDGMGLIGKKAAGVLGNVVYWMSPEKFCMLSSTGPQPIPCTVWDKVFQNINLNYYSLIRCATNSVFGEVTWYYPANGYNYNNSYVKYNVYTQQWDYGTLPRCAWIDQSVLGTPIGANPIDGVIYQHEIGYNDGTNPMVSSFETGYMQLNDADNLIFIDQIWPDFKWQTDDGTTTSATVYITFFGVNYPGDAPTQYGPYAVTKNTEYLSVRIRNRLVRILISTTDGTNTQLNSFFRIGALRYRFQLDGKF